MDNNELLKIEQLSKKFDETNIPLYLSYPTESWWKDEVNEETFTEDFRRVEEPFLYFHFPYCKKPCYYCCCYKSITNDNKVKDIYLEHLDKEFMHKLSALGLTRFKNVRHMHWGGGTPTFMTFNQLEKVYNSIISKIDISGDSEASISIEAYPDDEDITPEKLRLIREMGFNEISFGVQDFDERIQKAINRNCKKEVLEKIITWARELGFRIHIDLCYGLPFQGLNELERTVRDIVEMKPDRVAVFSYAHYPMIFAMQRFIPSLSLPNSFIKVLLAKTAEEIFTSSGYCGVGTDHFVKESNLLHKASTQKNILRDFMGYSVIQRRYFIGFGNSAISFSGKRYYHNQISIKDYLECVNEDRIPLIRNKAHLLSDDDIIRNKLIQKSILCDFEIDKDEINKEFSIEFDNYFTYELQKLADYEKDEIVEFTDSDTIKITPYGKMFVRHIGHVFDSYYGQRFNRIAGLRG